MRLRTLRLLILTLLLHVSLCDAVLSEEAHSVEMEDAYSGLEGSIWDLYGSSLRVARDGVSIRFVVVRPNHFLRLAQVQPGSVLIDAHIEGSAVKGTAFMFDRRCGSFLYQVHGLIDFTSTRIVLKGNAPLVDHRCNTFGYRFDRMELVKLLQNL